MPDLQIMPFRVTTQRVKVGRRKFSCGCASFAFLGLQVVIVSVTAGIALLGFLARYLKRRRTVRPPRRARKLPGGRRTRNSMRSPNGEIEMFFIVGGSFMMFVPRRCHLGGWFQG